MKKYLAFIKKYIWLITTIIAIIGLMVSIFQARSAAKSPILGYYVVRVSPDIKDNDLQTARHSLENSLFLSVNDLVSQNPNLSYSEALDSVLPASETVGNLPGGVVIVVQNHGEITARNVRVSISTETPIEKYEIFSNETFSVSDEDKSKGIIKIDIDRLTTGDKIEIAILFPGEYTVSLMASRGNYSIPSSEPTPQTTTMIQVATKVAMTQMAKEASQPDEKILSGILYFHVENYLDKILVNVFASSDEVQGDVYPTPQDTSREKSLFFKAFQP